MKTCAKSGAPPTLPPEAPISLRLLSERGVSLPARTATEAASDGLDRDCFRQRGGAPAEPGQSSWAEKRRSFFARGVLKGAVRLFLKAKSSLPHSIGPRERIGDSDA